MVCCVSGMRRKSAMITECVFVPSISILCVFFSHSDSSPRLFVSRGDTYIYKLKVTKRPQVDLQRR